MASQTSLLDAISLSHDVIAALFAAAETSGLVDLESGEAEGTLDFYCHIDEGPWCYIVKPGYIETINGNTSSDIERQKVDRDLAMTITRELDPKLIEHSKNRIIKVRCNKTGSGGDAAFHCQIDRGDGWHELGVR